MVDLAFDILFTEKSGAEVVSCYHWYNDQLIESDFPFDMGRTLDIFAIFVSLSVATSLGQGDQCEFSADSAKESAKAVSNLAVKLYQQVAKSDQNSIFSPVSIALALALVENGAIGGTKNEIQSLIGSPGQDYSSNSYQSLQHQLQINGQNSRMSIANGLFYSENLRLKTEYVNKVKECFETQVTKESFSSDSEGARRQINQWVSKVTQDKIPELLKQGSIDEDTLAVLASAIYMKTAWQDKLSGSEDLPFYQSGKTDQAKTIQFITRVGQYGYSSSDNLAVVEIPYKEAPLSMYIILPKERDGIQDVEKSLHGDQLISLFENTASHRVSLKLPKFTMRQSADLKQVLANLGLHQMFSNRANFSRMSTDNVKISSAIHEAYIKVNENGTEAAAATAFGFGAAVSGFIPPPDPPIPFLADHPFIFTIVHKPTGAITFMGKVNSVQEQE